MTTKQKRDRVIVINNTLREMAERVKTEERAMTDDEQKERELLVREREILKTELVAGDQSFVPIEQKTRGQAFGELIAGMKNRSIPEDYREYVEEETILIRDVQDTSTVGAITPITISDIIEPLEKGFILPKVGVKVQTGVVGQVDFPIVAGVEASVYGEDVEINDTKIDIDKISLNPKRVAISVPVTNQAQNKSGNRLFEIVRKQIGLSLTRVLNHWAFSPTAFTGTEGGCFTDPKNTLTSTGNAWKDAIALKGAVMKEGVILDDSVAYVCSASKYAELEATPRDAGSGLMVIVDGKINGIPVFITEYIGEGVLGFGVFSYMVVAQFGTMRMTVDPYTQAKKDRIVFTLNADFDMLSLRKEAFAVLKDATPTT